MIKDENLKYIFSTEAIRDKAESILQFTLEGRTQFHLFPEKLEEVADYVLKVMKEKYPDNKELIGGSPFGILNLNFSIIFSRFFFGLPWILIFLFFL